jgi:hypothetical protein
MFRNIDNEHLSGKEIRQLFNKPHESIRLNDHLKICEYCAEKYREAVELILQEKEKSTALFSPQSQKSIDN